MKKLDKKNWREIDINYWDFNENPGFEGLALIGGGVALFIVILWSVIYIFTKLNLI